MQVFWRALVIFFGYFFAQFLGEKTLYLEHYDLLWPVGGWLCACGMVFGIRSVPVLVFAAAVFSSARPLEIAGQGLAAVWAALIFGRLCQEPKTPIVKLIAILFCIIAPVATFFATFPTDRSHGFFIEYAIAFASTALCGLLFFVTLAERFLWRQKAIVLSPVLFIYLCVHLLTQGQIDHQEERENYIFSRLAAQTVDAVVERIFEYELNLDSISRFYQSSTFVDRDEFRQFTSGILSKYPEITAIEWVPKVPDGKRAEVEERAKGDGLGDFEFFEYDENKERKKSPHHPEYFPILYAEPQAVNAAVFGFDIFSSLERRINIEQMLSMKKGLVTSPLHLIQNQKSGFLYLWPIFSGGEIQGIAMIVIEAERMIQGVIDDSLRRLCTVLVEDIYEARPQLLYTDMQDAGLYTVEMVKDIGARTWRFCVKSTPLYEQSRGHSDTPLYLHLLGIFLVISLLCLLLFMTGQIDEIETVVVQRTEQILLHEERMQEVIEELNRSNEELERFAYVAAHDMQEPLRMVVNFGELLQMKLTNALDTKSEEYLKIVIASGKRMQALVADLLQYARIGADLAQNELFDVGMILSHVEESLKDEIRASQATLTSDTLPHILGNPVRVGSLLHNLIGNAIKYRSKTRPLEIHIGVKDEGDSWVFCVKDTGIGMQKEHLTKIFLPFQRLHTTTKEYAGTGMGLAIAAKVVANMGGKIWADSEINVGSSFFFTIPKRST